MKNSFSKFEIIWVISVIMVCVGLYCSVTLKIGDIFEYLEVFYEKIIG